MNDVAVIPACLRDRPQWVAWRYIERDGKQTKAPVNANTGGLAASTDLSTWTTFSQALAACQQRPNLAGVGFVFTPDDPYCGVDLDDCIDPETGQIKTWAAEFIRQLDSYAEISPSGAGVKVFLKANKPGSRCRKAYEDGEVEIYDRDRFFTVTGQRLDGVPATVEIRQEQLDAVYRAVFGDDGHSDSDQKSGPCQPHDRAVYVVLDDDQIIDLASNQRRSGAKFATLWSGDWNAYFNSASEADSSVVFTLAFYTKDAAQIDRLFRRSGLMRPKWDEQHGEQTYGATTIAKALAKVTKQYQPKRNGKRKSSRLPTRPLTAEPSPGSVDPTTGRLILATDRTLPTAEAFVRQFYRHPEGRTLHNYAGLNMAWCNNRYVEVEDNAMRHQLLPWLHTAVRMVYDHESETWVATDFPANPHTVRAALESTQAYTHLSAATTSPCWLAGDGAELDPRDFVPCRSSLLHLPTLTHRACTPRFFTVNALDYDPDFDAPRPVNWHHFLQQLFSDDVQSVELLQDWFGYCLTGDTSQHKMLLIVGPPRSGKGTIARVLTQLVGSGNVGGPTTSSLAGPFGLQPLIGKSLAIVSDARFSGDSIQTVVERLLCISGEDTLTIDRKHLGSVTMKLPTRLVFLTNELPRMNDASGALASRFMMLRLIRSFYGYEDREITRKQLAELPGIINCAIDGWLRLRERGAFVQPESVEDAIRETKDLASPVGAFVREQCVVGAGRRIRVDDLYEAWKTWCVQDGRSGATTRQRFGKDLMAVVPGLRCRRNEEGRFYEGIDLTGETFQ